MFLPLLFRAKVELSASTYCQITITPFENNAKRYLVCSLRKEEGSLLAWSADEHSDRPLEMIPSSDLQLIPSKWFEHFSLKLTSPYQV